MRRLSAALLLVITVATTPHAQSPRRAAIAGRVIDDGGDPVIGVRVTVERRTAGGGVTVVSSTETDDRGEYRVPGLAAGAFLVAVATSAGTPRPGPPGKTYFPGVDTVEAAESVIVQAGSDRTDVDVFVRADQSSYQPFSIAEDGRRQLVPADVPARLTDDFGRYRLYGLEAGQYIVSASIGSVFTGDVPGYLRSYFPATSDPVQAQFVPVRASEELAGIDLSMVRGRTARVAGRILDPGGAPTTGGSVLLRPRQRSSVAGMSVGARLSDAGFEFLNVPPGDYVIQVNRDRTNSWTEGPFGALPVIVSGSDVTGLVLEMSNGSTVVGAIRFDTLDPSKLPAPSGIELSALPVDVDLSPRNVATANIRGDWTFLMAGLNGPRRLELQKAPPGWMLKEILIGGIDAADRPISFGRREESLAGVEVVLTDRVNELSGTITDDRTGPAAGSNVIVFSTDQDLAFLDGLSRNASVVTITEGQQRSINVRLYRP